MRLRFFLALQLALGCLGGCAPQRQTLQTQAPPPPQPPALTDDQLLGLQRPPGMIKDPDTDEYALPEVLQSFWKLKKKAAQDGWHLILVSGYRSFKHQREIWNHYDSLYQKTDKLDEKGRVRAVMSLVSVPGLSRHHWGTDLDISEASLRGQLVLVHPDTPERVVRFYQWMEENAPRFGFCKVYLGKRGAVRDEPWHWSYFPFSNTYQKQFMAIQDFHKILNNHVDDVKYLMRNFPKVFQQETRSFSTECSLEAAPSSSTPVPSPTISNSHE